MRPAPPLRQKRWHLAMALALGAAGALASPPVMAQASEDLAQLRQVFAEGRTFESKGQWAEALAKFKEVAAAKMTPQVRFHMALCEENLGKLVSALHGFELAGAEATAAGSSAVEVPANAKEHADGLRERVAKLQIEVTGKLTTSRLTLDGKSVMEKDLGTPIDVDPGAHVVEVRDANGKSTFHKELTLAEKGSEKVDVDAADSAVVIPPPSTSAPTTGGSSRAPAVVAGALGLGALAFSGVFFVLRADNIAAISQSCSNMAANSGCTANPDLASTGRTYTTVADALLAVGIVGVGAGTILWFTLGPKAQPGASPGGSSPSPAASLRIVPAGTGLKVIGVF